MILFFQFFFKKVRHRAVRSINKAQTGHVGLCIPSGSDSPRVQPRAGRVGRVELQPFHSSEAPPLVSSRGWSKRTAMFWIIWIIFHLQQPFLLWPRSLQFLSGTNTPEKILIIHHHKAHAQALQHLSTWGPVPVLKGALFRVPESNHLSRTRLVIPSHAEKLPAGGTWFHLCVFARLWHEVNSRRIYQMSLCGVGSFGEQKSSSVYA